MQQRSTTKWCIKWEFINNGDATKKYHKVMYQVGNMCNWDMCNCMRADGI